MYHYLGGAPLPPRTVDGFATAGDLGWLDAEGYLHIVDRRVDLIITGGANVFPAEVETALIDHPGSPTSSSSDCRTTSGAGGCTPSSSPPTTTTRPPRTTCIAFAKARLAAYKVPKSVEFVDVIPRSEATKVSRAALIDARGG